MRRFTMPVLLVFAMSACESDSTGPDDDDVTFDYDFATATHGWEAGFADYPVEDDESMELESSHAPLPAELDADGNGLYIAGTNTSDDLFMFWKRQVTGLEPNETYEVSFVIEFATSAPSGCVGIGGAPGESVHLKAGASTSEPDRVVEQVNDRDYYRMDIDKGNQAESGADAVVIGHIANTNTDCNETVWEMKTVSEDDAVEVTADAAGTAWLIVGTDSGFEGRTELYFTSIRAEFDD